MPFPADKVSARSGVVRYVNKLHIVYCIAGTPCEEQGIRTIASPSIVLLAACLIWNNGIKCQENEDKIMVPTQTLTRFIQARQREHPQTTGELTDLLNAIALGVKIIGQLVSTSGFRGLKGYTGNTNVQGEATHVLDEQADQTLVELLGSSGHFGLLLSEERESVISTMVGRETAKYVVAFDPLDGSSNLTANIPVGTIFTIYRKRDLGRPAAIEDFLQTGRGVVAAGYALYGPKTTFTYSSGQGVHGFTLDTTIGEFILTDESIATPEFGSTYSINEGNSLRWDRKISSYVAMLKGDNKERRTPYSARYVGSLVADFDRNLKKGGVFLYPHDAKNPRGKLRLLYECVPLAYIAEQAGGRAVSDTMNILDMQPKDIHERTPFIVGSKTEVQWFEELR